MKTTFTPIVLILVTLASVLVSCSKEATRPLVIWTYDSFVSEWGPGTEIARRFKAETGLELTWEIHGDAGTLLSRLILEGKEAKADIILGLDQNMAEKALETGLLSAYKPENTAAVFPELLIDPDWRLIPFDYSYFAVNYDSETITSPPESLEDLTRPEYQDKLILMDPRTSSPGLGFFGWVKAVYGAGWKDYWKRLQPSILTIAESWDSGYGLFSAGEAPLVLSYTTSPGYHMEYEGSSRFKAAIFPEGHPIQIELAGLLKAAPNRANAQQFLDFMLSAAFQETIPLGNWMYPVIDIPLPDSFGVNPKSDKPLYPPPTDNVELDEWAALFR